MNTFIKIAFSGQVDSDTKIIFTYPEPFNRTDGLSKNAWLQSVRDPRDARNFNCEEAFAYWKNEQGNYYAIIVPNREDSRKGLLMTTVFTGYYIVNSGKIIIDTLRQLSSHFITQDINYSSISIDSLVQNLNNSLSNDLYSFDMTRISQKKAFRIFNNEKELEEILENPHQEEYQEYNRILVVPKDSIPSQLPSVFTEIKSRIIKTYTLGGDIPEGVEIDKTWCKEGESIQITYSKSGYLQFKPRPLTINGVDNSFIHYSGTMFYINDEKNARIQFKRGIYFKCVSLHGIEVSNFTVKYNKKKQTYSSAMQFVFDEDKTEYNVTIEANGFENIDVKVSTQDLQNGSKEIKLVPKQKRLSVLLDTPDGNIEGNICINGNDPLYRYFNNASNNREPIKLKIQSNKVGNVSNEGSFLSNIWHYAKRLLIILSVIYAIYALFLLIENKTAPWPFNKSQIVKQDSVTSKNDEDTLRQNDSSEKEDPDRISDIDYLKRNDTWDKSQIKTENYKVMFDYLRNGQIDQILSNSWFRDNNDKVNGYWKKIAEYLNTIKGKSNPDLTRRAQEELKRLCKDENHINLSELSNSLYSLTNPPLNQSYDFSQPETVTKQLPPIKATSKEQKAENSAKKGGGESPKSQNTSRHNNVGRESSH